MYLLEQKRYVYYMTLQKKQKEPHIEFLETRALDPEWVRKIRKLVILPSSKHYNAQKNLVEGSMEIINTCKEFSRLKGVVYYELSKYGENLRAEREGLFAPELWNNKKNRKEILRLIRAFLLRRIK